MPAMKSFQNIVWFLIRLNGFGVLCSALSYSSFNNAVRSVEAVIWDIDGTIVNSHVLAYQATNHVLKKHGYTEIEEQLYHLGTKYPTHLRFAWHLDGEHPPQVGPEAQILGDDFDQLFQSKVTKDTVPMFLGLKETIEWLHRGGTPQGVVSNGVGDYVRDALHANGLSPFFEVQSGADEVPAPKPSPQGILQCCSTMGVDPRKCIYIGDAPTDGQAARAAGMQCVGVTWGSYSLGHIRPNFDHIAHNQAELPLILAAIGANVETGRAASARTESVIAR
mmetsp:Transcript_43416/g.71930  ORF Transcript_43416/g.71930 Transcript_43416/m.71930 type:complete len:278 (+) Transcript_43416:59-892(+)